MGKTGLSIVIATVLIVVSLAVHAARRLSHGSTFEGPAAASSWRVSLTVAGDVLKSDASLTTRRPLDFRHQHIADENFQSKELIPPQGKKRMDRADFTWRPLHIPGQKSFRANYSFRCWLGLRQPTAAMHNLTREIDAAPQNEEALKPSQGIESNHEEIAKQAKELIEDDLPVLEQANRFFSFVSGLENEPSLGARSALQCLRNGGGDSGGKSRLLMALCRQRGIPARLLSGLILAGEGELSQHSWCEAWVDHHWLPMCPTQGHFGRSGFPKNYFIWHIGEEPIVHGRSLTSQFGFLAKKLDIAPENADGEPLSWSDSFWQKTSLVGLRPAEQHVVKFLLLLPLAALIVSMFRTMIGITTFGTFSPALIGLAFLDLKALPLGMTIFITTILVGWSLRRGLNAFHLLQVPRTSIMLTLIVFFLVLVIVLASHRGIPITQYISLFPLVILTHLVERFWTVEAEDGTATSFKTLAGTFLVAVTISVALSPPAVARWMFHYPETLGMVLAGLFLLGRYTGYRVTELFRFRDFLHEDAKATVSGGKP